MRIISFKSCPMNVVINLLVFRREHIDRQNSQNWKQNGNIPPTTCYENKSKILKREK